MRVLLMPASYAPVLGGVQSVAHTLASHLEQNGHLVRVVTNRYPRTLPRQERVDNVRVERRLFLWPTVDYVRRRRVDLFLASFYYGPFTLISLLRRMQEFRPDAVNVHFADSQIPFILWLDRFFDFRLVVSLHGDDVERWFKIRSDEETATNISNRSRQLFSELLSRADAITTCSRYLLGQTQHISPSVEHKGMVIHNGINPERFYNRQRYFHSHAYIFACGRLTHDKGFDMLLTAFTRLADEDEYDSLDLLLAGDGEEHPPLYRQSRQSGRSERINFLGRVSSSEIIELLNGASAVIIPSRRESFGIVALEALAAGAPVVATAVGGLTELVTPAEQNLTWLVSPTVEGLTQGIREALNTVSGTEGPPYPPREDVLQQYSWSSTVTQYERVLAGKTPSEARGVGV